MLGNSHTTRSLVSFLIAWSFVAMIVTGIVLYLVPQGRVARMTNWSLLGLDKWQWGDVHIVFGVVFIIAGVWHLWLNWTPFMHYWAERTRNRWRIKPELLISIAMVATIAGLAVADLPPASWVSGLQDSLKQQQGFMIPGGRKSQTRLGQRGGGKGRGSYRHGKP